MSNMNSVLELSEYDGVAVVEPQGDTTGFRLGTIENDLKKITETFAQTGSRHLVVDLGKANYFGSIVMNAIKTLGDSVQASGGDIVLCNASEEMRKTMSALHLDSGWMHFDNRKTALKAMRARMGNS